MITNDHRDPPKALGQSGFTIIELMIATVVFSMVLLLLTTAVISFTKSYYKGITEANTQRVARSVTESITQTIQLNSATYTSVPLDANGWQGFCFGDETYVYKLHWQLTDGSTLDVTKHQISHVLLKVNAAGGCAGKVASDLVKLPAEELLSPSMRLANLAVNPLSNGLYALTISVVYGDDDLLSDWTALNPMCNGQSGAQFCAVSGMSTVVLKRIQQ